MKKQRSRTAHARKTQVLSRPALRIEQHPSHPLFVFALTGEELWRIATISHVARDRGGRLVGYQRAAVGKHIRNIVEYLDNGPVLFPSSLVLAFSSAVRFRPRRGRPGGTSTHGTLDIPLPWNGDPKPAWIVDGQQRALALSLARRRDLPVPVSGFVADDVTVQREQFLRVNSTKPLPRGLTTELLPEIASVLPPLLAERRLASSLVDMLNRDPDSPFRRMIRRASMGKTSSRQVNISDTTLVRILQESLASPSGCLFAYRNLATGELDSEGARRVLLLYWNAVKQTFPDAWGVAPTRSRLMHSVGLRAMGRLMNRLMAGIEMGRPGAGNAVRKELERIRPLCHWTGGSWEGLDGMRWNELQNVPTHVRMLSDLILRHWLESQGA